MSPLGGYWRWCRAHEARVPAEPLCCRGWRTWIAYRAGRTWLPAATATALRGLVAGPVTDDRLRAALTLLQMCGTEGPAVPESLMSLSGRFRRVPGPGPRGRVALRPFLEAYERRRREAERESCPGDASAESGDASACTASEESGSDDSDATVELPPEPPEPPELTDGVSSQQVMDVLDARFQERLPPPPRWQPEHVQRRMAQAPPPESLVLRSEPTGEASNWRDTLREMLRGDMPGTCGGQWADFLEAACMVLHPCTRWRAFVALMASQRRELDRRHLHIRVARGAELEDALPLASVLVDLRRPLHVIFVDRQGAPEAGQDAGGLLREFLERFWERVAEMGFFEPGPSGALVPSSRDVAGQLPAFVRDRDLFFLLGRMLGKCVREQVCVPRLARYVWEGLMRRGPTADPLERLGAHDPELAERVGKLRGLPPRELAALELPCCVTFQRFAEPAREVPLWVGAEHETVHAGNLERYLVRLAEWHTLDQFGTRLGDLGDGLHSVVPHHELTSRFLPDEFVALFCEAERPPSVADLVPWTRCEGEGEWEADLWEALGGLERDRGPEVAPRLLRFVTGSAALSEAGPGALFEAGSPLTVHWTDADGLLPTASTCANTLYLPGGAGREALRRGLEYVLFDCGREWGFHLM